MQPCALRPADKRKLIAETGAELVREHGKQKYYKPEDVRKAARKRGYEPDVICWAECIFTSLDDFNRRHAETGESCDYVAMKSEVLGDLSAGEGFQWPDIDLSWLEWPDIDLSSIFDGFDISL